ncbi:MAG: hypothetical protein KZQ77_05775 [Candidatus Thiodiazotropha sp. (ex Notomyrtea botanica)]|nr:hypothetical protein [Candidatus Thiodiazotropha sp. (ex Notomyrtea botanica)]
MSLLHIDDLARIVKSYIEGDINLEKNTEHILGDYETYKVNDVVDNIRELHGLRTYRREIESSDFLKVATKLLPITSLKYWSRVLVDEHYFTAEPTQDASLSGFDFISLREGLTETYSIKASNKLI